MKIAATFLLVGMLVLAGCAQHLPVPGGDSMVNHTFYNSDEEFLKIVEYLEAGMSQDEVFFRLGVTEEDLIRLDRSGIVNVLYGGSSAQLSGGFQDRRYTRDFLRSLYGYKFEYTVIRREHGFSSAIRIKTKEIGFRYLITLIFQNGYLFEKPILSGGSVNNMSSSTIFDFINPSTVMNEVR